MIMQEIDIPCAIISSPRPSAVGSGGIVYTDLCSGRDLVMANQLHRLLNGVILILKTYGWLTRRIALRYALD